MQADILIKNGTIVLFDRLLHGDIQIRNGFIYAIGNYQPAVRGKIEIDATGKYILPGFIDIHTHGANGFDFTNGRFDQEKGSFLKDQKNYHFGLQQAIQKYLATGTTGVVLATVSAPDEELIQSFEYFDQFLKNYAAEAPHNLLGILVEGTFIKDKAFAGAQNPDFFQSPSIALFEKYQSAAGGRIRSVNVTPEYDATALELIDYLSRKNILVCAGHTGATADEYLTAVQKGLRVALHFLNGPTGSSTKPFGHGGAIQAVLRSHDVFAELITDGYHVDPLYVREVIHRKGLQRIIAITDSMFVTGLEDIATFIISGVLGRVSANRRYLEVVGSQNTLFGSVLTMDVAFSNIISWLTKSVEGIWREHLPAVSFEDALIQATWMCSRNPAKVLKIMRPEVHYYRQDLNQYTGSLDVGKRADILVTTIRGEPGKYNIKVENVILKGHFIS